MKTANGIRNATTVFFTLLVLCVLHTPAYGGPIHFGLNTYLSYGPIEGYTQTPSGGEPGTTSLKRPTFEEMGIDNTTIYGLELSATRDRHSIFAGVNLLGLSSEKTLNQDLIFHALEYPAGTRVEFDVVLNWYDMGYEYNWPVSEQLTVTPAAILSLWQFNVELEADGFTNRRTYAKVSVRAGLEAEYRISEKFSLSAKVTGSLPLDNTPRIYTASVEGKYTVTTGPSYQIEASIGPSYTRIEYEDNQLVPNHILAEMGPMVLLGLTIRSNP